MDITSLTIPAALVTGLAFGAGPCNVTCLPYLGPVFLKGEGIRKSWKILLPFTLGRLTGYSLLGLAAGIAGQALTELLQSSIAGWILGVAAILVGLNLMRHKTSSSQCSSHHASQEEQSVRLLKPSQINKSTDMMPGALFAMGAGMALNPCVPLTAVLAAAAASGSTVSGLSLGLAFGIGAVFIPTFIFGLLVAHFGQEIKQNLSSFEKHIMPASGSLLILLGLATILGWVQP